jgi:hypothetical protein
MAPSRMFKAFTSERCFERSTADQAYTEFGGLEYLAAVMIWLLDEHLLKW